MGFRWLLGFCLSFLVITTLRCQEDELIIRGCANSLSGSYDSASVQNDGSCLPIDCNRCRYIIREKDHRIDGAALGLKAGDYICLDRNRTSNLRLINIKGTASNPIVLVNCGRQVSILVPIQTSFALKFERSSHFRVTSVGPNDHSLVISGGVIGLTLDYLSTNFEVDHLEVKDVGFAGIMAKTDPRCDSATHRGNFTLRNISLHDNYVHNVGGEGFYVGNSFYTEGAEQDTCGVLLPHEVENAKIYNNYTKHTGREGIQLGCGVRGAEIHDNRVEDFGYLGLTTQDNGIQVGDGTSGLCYNNMVFNGKGAGIIVLGLGGNKLFNNIIANTGGYGIFCNDRLARAQGFTFANNTIVRPATDGIRMYSNGELASSFINNLIVEPGNYEKHVYPDDWDAFLQLQHTERMKISHNLLVTQMRIAQFLDPESMNFELRRCSPAVNWGTDVSELGIDFDFQDRHRPIRLFYDVGAYECATSPAEFEMDSNGFFCK